MKATSENGGRRLRIEKNRGRKKIASRKVYVANIENEKKVISDQSHEKRPWTFWPYSLILRKKNKLLLLQTLNNSVCILYIFLGPFIRPSSPSICIFGPKEWKEGFLPRNSGLFVMCVFLWGHYAPSSFFLFLRDEFSSSSWFGPFSPRPRGRSCGLCRSAQTASAMTGRLVFFANLSPSTLSLPSLPFLFLLSFVVLGGLSPPPFPSPKDQNVPRKKSFRVWPGLPLSKIRNCQTVSCYWTSSI